MREVVTSSVLLVLAELSDDQQHCMTIQQSLQAINKQTQQNNTLFFAIFMITATLYAAASALIALGDRNCAYRYQATTAAAITVATAIA
eukprot:13843-Heterococcus_DN1.PRE.1